MLWLYILLGILLAIFLLLLVPVGVTIKYENDFLCRLKVGFVPITIYPPKPKKKKNKSAKKKKTKQDSKQEHKEEPKEKKTNLLQEKGLSWFINLIKKVAELAKDVLKDFFKHIIINKFMLSITISGNDAADKAIKYGKLCASVYPAAVIITGKAKCKKCGIDIAPDFDKKSKASVYFDLKARTIVLRIVGLIIKYGFKGIKLMLEIKDER